MAVDDLHTLGLDEADAEALALRREVDAAWQALGWPWIDHYASMAEAITALKGAKNETRMKHLGGNHYELSTGRRLDASAGGYIGLNAGLRVGLGYDHAPLEIDRGLADAEGIEVDPDECWTSEERAELADFMIAQWQAFKAKERPEPPK